METRFVKNDFIITPIKGTKICYQSPSIRWDPRNPQMLLASTKSLSSIMHNPNKNMVCDNENSQSYNSECSNENN